MSFWSLTTSEFLLLQQSAQQACWKEHHAALPIEQLSLHNTQTMCIMPFSTVKSSCNNLEPFSRNKAKSNPQWEKWSSQLIVWTPIHIAPHR